MDPWTIAVSLLSPAIVGAAIFFGLKKYIGSYLDQKGKNLATHEDIQNLVDQVRATERVKAEITDNVWDRQERWKAKHAMYREILAALADLYHAKITEAAAIDVKHQITEAQFKEITGKSLVAAMKLNTLVMTSVLTIGSTTMELARPISEILRLEIRKQIVIISNVTSAITLAARIDLGYAPLSSEFLAKLTEPVFPGESTPLGKDGADLG